MLYNLNEAEREGVKIHRTAPFPGKDYHLFLYCPEKETVPVTEGLRARARQPLVNLSKMENTSPRKYIQTRARSLPIYKCYASRNWERAGLANVIVTRRHVNKKITGGIYLVDLKCLGVKDTSWFFNLTEEDFFESHPDFEERFMEIGYNLAHNIIYAGYDFAMEFDITPHKDFAVTKHILEEDDDEIPIIDIAVGDKDGLPHLMTYSPTEHLDALARLKKNAGEGNYHYTYAIGGFSEDEEYDDEDDLNNDDEEISLSDIEPGSIDPDIVKKVPFEELMDTQRLKNRDEREQLICLAEAFIRLVAPMCPLTREEEDLMERERDYYYENDADYNDDEVAAYQECVNMFKKDPMDEQGENEENRNDDRFEFLRIIREAQDNPICIALLNIVSLQAEHEDEKVDGMLIEKMKASGQHDIMQLSLALRALVTNDNKESYSNIAEQPGYNNIFSGKTGNFHEDCLTMYYLIQVIRYSQANRIALAIDYYHLLSGQHESMLFMFGRALFYPVFIQALVNQVDQEKSPLRVD